MPTVSKLKTAFKPVQEIWATKDFVKRSNVALGLTALAVAPLGAMGVYANEAIYTDKVDPNTFKGQIFKATAFTYPVVWSFLQMVSVGQGVLAGSITSLIDGLLIFLSSFFYGKITYDRLNTKLKLSTQDPDNNDLKHKLETSNQLINFFTKAIYVGLLSWYGEFTALPDLSKDVGKSHQIKPFESQDKLKNFWGRVRENFSQEINATKQAFVSSFNPRNWRGTIFGKNEQVENMLREKGITGVKAVMRRIGSSTLPTAFACISAISRLASGIIFIGALPFVGLKAFTDKKPNPEEKAAQYAEHPIAKRLFDFANILNSVVLWNSGLMSLTMGFSNAYEGFAGPQASKLQAGARLLSVAAGSNSGPTGRLLTFLSTLALTFANGLRNIVGAKK